MLNLSHYSIITETTEDEGKIDEIQTCVQILYVCACAEPRCVKRCWGGGLILLARISTAKVTRIAKRQDFTCRNGSPSILRITP